MKFLVPATILCALLVCVVSGHVLERPAGLACWFTGCASTAEAAIGRKLSSVEEPLDTTGEIGRRLNEQDIGRIGRDQEATIGRKLAEGITIGRRLSEDAAIGRIGRSQEDIGRIGRSLIEEEIGRIGRNQDDIGRKLAEQDIGRIGRSQEEIGRIGRSDIGRKLSEEDIGRIGRIQIG